MKDLKELKRGDIIEWSYNNESVEMYWGIVRSTHEFTFKLTPESCSVSVFRVLYINTLAQKLKTGEVVIGVKRHFMHRLRYNQLKSLRKLKFLPPFVLEGLLKCRK